MSAPSRQRTPNPHLGAYYGIVASGFVSLVILLAMAEQLGWSDGTIARSLILLPLALYLAIAVAARTLDVKISSPRAGACPRSITRWSWRRSPSAASASSPIPAPFSSSASTRSPSASAGLAASCSPRFCSCRICAGPAPIRSRPFSANASARARPASRRACCRWRRQRCCSPPRSRSRPWSPRSSCRCPSGSPCCSSLSSSQPSASLAACAL